VTERVKGLLMERHHVDELEAFEMLRREARRSQQKLVDVAESVLSTYLLLPSQPTTPDGWARQIVARPWFDPYTGAEEE